MLGADDALADDSVVLVRDGAPVTRAQFRAEALATIPASDAPALHLLALSLPGLVVAAAALLLVRAPTPIDAWLVPLVVMACNAAEWRMHKHTMHVPATRAAALFDAHTCLHHRLYMTDSMAIRERRELRFVLLPSYSVALLLAAVAPFAGAAAWFGQRNAACLLIATVAVYALSYEWLHVACHLPRDHFVGRLPWVRVVRERHAIHHDPRLMQRWNMNITLPLWDWVRGSVWRGD